MDDNSLNIIIAALLPLTACMLVLQVNPYHALVIRGVLGAIAALVYAVLGAADVALTEALMGTLLSITLYAVAVRSSLVLRLGLLEDKEGSRQFEKLMAELQTLLDKHYLRLEVVPYSDLQALEQALREKEVHATCWRKGSFEDRDREPQTDLLTIRVQRIYDILQAELSSPGTLLTYVKTPNLEEKH
jgi:putative multicomponent Na+:H+ antiporter subunit B